MIICNLATMPAPHLLFLTLLLSLTLSINIIQDQPCPSIIGCDICDNPESGKCDQCSQARNFVISPDEDGLCQCLPDLWLSSDKSQCQECQSVIDKCLQCSSSDDRSTICFKCTEGFFWDNTACAPCSNSLPNCLKCTQDGTTCQ